MFYYVKKTESFCAPIKGFKLLFSNRNFSFQSYKTLRIVRLFEKPERKSTYWVINWDYLIFLNRLLLMLFKERFPASKMAIILEAELTWVGHYIISRVVLLLQSESINQDIDILYRSVGLRFHNLDNNRPRWDAVRKKWLTNSPLRLFLTQRGSNSRHWWTDCSLLAAKKNHPNALTERQA